MNKLKVGNIIQSKCGDKGLVLKIGPRPDVGCIKRTGVYAHWVKENLAFWMDMDEPEISLCAEREIKYEC
jgi:hypothetical protein